ncbi:MAG TPA: polysaccharide deacetylase family protein [Coleofasciculaceae cyanobacterium]
MADRHLFVWQQSLSVGLVAIGVGFMAGLNLPINRVLNQSNTPKALLVKQQTLDPSTSHVKTLIAQQDEAFRKVIAALSLETKVSRLNSPIPVQFQGKTIREVQFNNQDKAIAPSGSAKPSSEETSLKPIALTFDDGPWPTVTSQVLDILKKNNVKATFFMVGRQVQRYPQLVKQVVAEGHALGNHTWNHQYHFFNESAAARELEDTASLIYKTTGVKTSLFRPPAGILNNGLVSYAHAKKHAVIMWSVDSRDWRYYGSTAQGLVDSVLKDAKPGGVVLMHDGGGDRSTTIKALPSLITQLKKRGYKLVTVPELLEMGNKKSLTNKD